MKKIYKILFFISLIIFIEDTFAQKNLKLVIDNVQVITSAYGNGGNPDRSCVGWCTGWGNSSKKPDIRWRILDGSGGTINNVNDGCWSVCDDCSTATRNTGSNTVVIDNNYNCASNWPSGNANFTIVTEEWDCVSVCSAGSTEELAKLSLSIPIPTSTNGNPIAATGSPFTATATKNVTCGNMTLALTVTMHWEVSSSFLFNSTNDDVCAAHDFGTLNAGANTGFITYNNTCSTTQPSEPRTGNMSNTMWYKFRTPSTGLLSATITAEEAGAGANYTAVAVYQKSGACSGVTGLTEVGFDRWCASNGGDVTVDCLLADTDYYIQLGTGYNFGACTDLVMGGRSTGDYRVRVTTNSNTAAPDNICNAVRVGAGTIGVNQSATTATYTNVCSTVNTGGYTDPVNADPNDATDWFYFTTPSTVPEQYYFKFNNMGDFGTWGGLEGEVYKQTGGTCPPTLSYVGSWDPSGCNVADESDGFCLDPSSTYYIMVDEEKDGLCGGRGKYQLSIRGSNYIKAPDNICNAVRVGATDIGVNQSATTATYSNYCSTVNTGGYTDPVNADGNDATDWFYFTTPASPASKYYFKFNNIADFGTWGGLEGEVYKQTGGTCPPTLSYVGKWDPPACGVIEESDGFCLDPSSTYFIMVDAEQDGACGGRGKYQLSIRGENSQKGADFCAQAISLGTLTAGGTIGDAAGNNRWNNFCATTAGDPDPVWKLAGVTTSPYQTVWFKFNTGSVGRSIRIDGYNDPHSWGDQIDLKLALYGGTCGALTLIDKDYDTPPWSETMEGEYCLQPNTDYYILVSGSNIEPATGSSREGYFGLTVKDNGPYPANDLVCGATTIPLQTAYTYNSAIFSNENNINGTNCFEPNPDWTAELGQDNDHGVWYFIGKVPGRTMVVDANSLAGDNIDIQMALYSSTVDKGSCTTPATTPTLTEVQKDYTIPSWDEDAYYNCLDPNKYYWLLVDGSDATGTGALSNLEQGNFSLRVWFPTEGSITFCNAQSIGTVPTGGFVELKNLSNICGTNTNTNMGVSPSSNVILPSEFSIDKAVIYKFVAPASGSVKVEAFSNPYYPGQMGLLTGDEIDIQLAVYEQSGGNCTTANFYPKANKYDPTDGFNEKMIVNCLNAGQTYYVMVDGSGLNTNGYFDLKISDYGISTPNDFLCNATTITGTMGAPWTNCNSNTVVTLTGQNNYCATITNDLPASLGGIPPTWGSATSGVWYKFKAPKSGKLKIEAKNSFPDYLPPYDEPEINIEMAVFRIPGGYNGTCANLSTEKDRLELVASEFDGLLHDEDFTVDCLMPDSIYYLLVDGSSNLVCPTCDRGEFYLTLTADPRDRPSTNDLPCDAIDLGTPAVWTNPTIYDTRVSPASGAATYSSPTTGYPSATGLHNGARNNAGSCMRAENNFCAGIAGEPAVNGGNFFTDFSPDATVWYKFTAPTTGEVKINTYNDPDSRGDQIYTQIAVFETSDNTCTGTMVGIAADGLPELNGNNELTVKCLDPGKTYFLMIDGAGVNIKGYFELQIQAVPATLTGPPNDDICNATPVTYPASIGVKTTLNNQTNRCATIQSGVYPSPTTFTTDADVWYTFTTAASPNNQAVKVEVTSGLPWPFGDAMDPQIALYKGSCPSSFTLVDDGYSALGLPFYESFEFHCLEPNTTYYLMVDGSGLNEQGNFKLDVTRISPHPLPTNDHICDVGISATNGYLGVLGGVTGNKIGSKNAGTEWHNFCSDVEPNENTLMTDGAYGLDQTVWFHFKTPNVANNVNVEIRALSDPNNVGDAIDLQMLLAQGNPTCPSANPFSSLTPIEAVDPALTFNATMDVCLPPNTDFYIQVDGSGLNTQGYFTLEIENMGTSSAPANDNICNAKVLPIGGVITGSYTGYLNDNNICATLEASEKQHIPGSIQRSVWYKFTTPTSADVSIEVKGNSWVPFSTNYFLPDITIWEVNDGTNTVGACGSVNWTKLDYNDSKYIPNSLANGVYPTVVLTPLCLKPNYTYFIQVDGTDGIGLDGYFDIRIKNNQPSYVGPSNNECGGATALTVGAKSCQISGGAWSTYNYGDPTWSRVPGGCTADCGDIWYKFTMPPACGNNTQSFVKVEGNDEMGALGVNNSQLAIAAYRGTCASMSYIKCSTGGVGVDPDFSISGTPGETIYLQVWDLNGDDFGKDFQLCISEQKSADDCVDATSMNLDVPYCFSVSSSGGETPNPSIPGSGLKTSCGAIDPVHSTYFKFTTDPTNTFCDDYYMYIKLEGLAKQIAGASLQNCSAGLTPSVEFSATVWEVKAGGTLCTPGPSNVTQRDCYKWNDCGTGSYGTNVSGPHGNGGVVNDTVWFNMGTGFAFQPNTTYYIVLDYEIKNALTFNGRYIEDGTIEIGRRCKGRVWEYTTASLITTNKYCTSSDGWRHYYDDKGTPSNTSDDKFIFSVYPNGNDFEGTATVHLEPTRYSYQDIPNDYAEYVMKRRWDYTLNFGSISPVKPVKIRFYYQTSEKQDIITAALNFKSLYGGAYEDFEWFKSTNGHVFNPLTDVNPRVISVGPNGYSEAGCLSWWNAAGVYIGPPGIKRCQDLSATDWEDNNTYQSCNGIHYVEYTGLTGFSGGTGGTGVSPWDISPLPVELVSFTGYNDGNKNVLNWTTASELNTLKFEVERKIPTTSSFEYIGEKPAAGNSNTPRIYTLEDINPAMGINYYRLKMIDIDGTFKYSNVIAISVLDIAQPQPDGIIAVYPNPTNNELNIVYQSKLANKVNLHVFNTLGQHMLSEGYNMHSGMNTITIKVTDFAKGMYILDMQNTTSGEKFQSKFIKD